MTHFCDRKRQSQKKVSRQTREMFECGIPATRIGTGVLSVLIFWFIFVFLFVFVFLCVFVFWFYLHFHVHLYDIGWDQCNIGSVSGTVVTNYLVCVSFCVSSCSSFFVKQGSIDIYSCTFYLGPVQYCRTYEGHQSYYVFLLSPSGDVGIGLV